MSVSVPQETCSRLCHKNMPLCHKNVVKEKDSGGELSLCLGDTGENWISILLIYGTNFQINARLSDTLRPHPLKKKHECLWRNFSDVIGTFAFSLWSLTTRFIWKNRIVEFCCLLVAIRAQGSSSATFLCLFEFAFFNLCIWTWKCQFPTQMFERGFLIKYVMKKPWKYL